ncbi:hypothetical protein GCM10010238_39110 [Streptomyces griseoviridis]|uniref:Uncharacterized protein n=1 Tax=Streptomyces griseoviridis TaxID=45398 RepID=A0A918LH02_STRGD|nr:hypothetical protein GCM10010238_39110 [Streptomyces niveoruber]
MGRVRPALRAARASGTRAGPAHGAQEGAARRGQGIWPLPAPVPRLTTVRGAGPRVKPDRPPGRRFRGFPELCAAREWTASDRADFPESGQSSREITRLPGAPPSPLDSAVPAGALSDGPRSGRGLLPL